MIKGFGNPACVSGGYPQLKRGSLSNYVLIAQDDLNTLGFSTGGLDGIFGSKTENAVKRYQTSRGLTSDGIVRLQYLALSSRKCSRNWKNSNNNRLGIG